MKPSKFFLKPAVFAVALCFAGAAAANPAGLHVVAGQAALQTLGKTLNIRNSNGAILNWQSFSIGAGETTRFIQPNAASSVLNRVVGQDPSQILGALQSNGRVFLINPNGIMFGAGSRVDVAGLVASTLNLSDRDFRAGRLNFEAGEIAGRIANAGTIATPQGGRIYLVAPDIENSGILRSARGEIVLAAGRSVQLVDDAAPDLRVEITAPDSRAVNLGEIVAASGRVGIHAGLIRQQGRVSADAARIDAAGRVVFAASGSTELAAGSRTSADGARGGVVAVDSGDGETLMSGTVSATGSRGQGGEVRLLGERVGLLGTAEVDASGKSGGGRIRVGGDFQGANPDLHNAGTTYVAPAATLRADATGKGNGGTIVVWADGSTRAGGELSARGGPGGGDGGLVEVSGKTWLDFRGHADTRAPRGIAGTLLLDPANVLVTDDEVPNLDPGAGFDGFGVFTGGSGPSTLTWSLINAALSDGNVVITTSGSEPGAFGDIVMSAPFGEGLASLSNVHKLSFLAHRHINVEAMHLDRSNGGDITLVAGWDGNVATPGLAVGATGSINFNPSETFGSGLITNKGDLTLLAAGSVVKNSGQSGSLVSGGGAVTIDARSTIGLTGMAINTTPDGIAATSGGAVTLTSGGGGVTIGAVTTRGTTNIGPGNGGAVRIVSRNGAISLLGDIDTRGADGFDGNGGNGGSIELAVGGDTLSPAPRETAAAWTISSNGSLNTSGGNGSAGSPVSPIGVGGNAGSITITTDLATSGGSIVLPNEIRADGGRGGSSAAPIPEVFGGVAGANGGFAGNVTIRAGSASDFSFSRIIARGGSGGDGIAGGVGRAGGTVMLRADRDIIGNGAHFFAGIHADGGSGGSIIDNGGNANAVGGSGGNGGSIDASAKRDLKMITGNDGGEISASGAGGGSANAVAGGVGGSGGSGGQVVLDAFRAVALDASLRATGASDGAGILPDGGGVGGSIRLEVHPSGGSGSVTATTGGSSGGIRFDTGNGGFSIGGGGSVAIVGVGGDLVVDSQRAPTETAIATNSVASFAIRSGGDITLKAPIFNATNILVSAHDAAAGPTSGGKVVFDRFASGGKHLLPLLRSEAMVSVLTPNGGILSRTVFLDRSSDIKTEGTSIVLDARDGIGGQPGFAAALNNPVFTDDFVDFGQAASLHFRNAGAGNVWIASHRPMVVDEGLASDGNIRLESAPNPGDAFNSPSNSEIYLNENGGNRLGLGGDVKALKGTVTYVADEIRRGAIGPGPGTFGLTIAGTAIEVMPYTTGASVSVDTNVEGGGSTILTISEIASFDAPKLTVGDFARTASATLLDSFNSIAPAPLNRPASLGGIEFKAAGNVLFNAPLLFAGGDVGGSSNGGNVTVNATAPITAANVRLDAGAAGTVNRNGALNASSSITLIGDTLNGAAGLSTPGALNIETSGGITLNASVGSFAAINAGGGTVSFTDLDGFDVRGIANPGGAIVLNAGTGPLTQSAVGAQTGLIAGSSLAVSGGDINLTLPNQVGNFSGTATTIISFASAGDFTAGAVSAPAVSLDAGSGVLTVAGPINAATEIALAGRTIGGASGLNTASLLVDTVDGFSGSGTVASLSARNTGSGDFSFSNSATLGVTDVFNAGGGIALTTSTGDIVGNGPITANGNVSLNAAGNIDNSGGIASGGGNVTLNAGGSIANNAPGIGSDGGLVTLSAAGDIATALIDAGTGTIKLASSGGAIRDIDDLAPTLIGAALDLSAATGIGTPLVALDTRSAALIASTGSGGIHISNVLPEAAGVFRVNGATATSGDIRIGNVGPMATAGPVRTGAGNLALVAQSPLSIGGAVFASGNILLQAGARAANGDLLTIFGNVTSSGGNISLDAADGITQDAAVSTGGGNIGVNTAGPFSMAPTATISSGNGPIAIRAGGNILLGFVDGGSGAVSIASQDGNIGSADPAITNNVRAGALNLSAGTGIKVTYSARSLQVNNRTGFVTVRNADTGAVISDDPALNPPPVDDSPGDEGAAAGPVGSTPDAVENAVNSSNASIANATDNVLPGEDEDASDAGVGDKKKQKKADNQGGDPDKNKDKDDKKGVGVCNA